MPSNLHIHPQPVDILDKQSLLTAKKRRTKAYTPTGSHIRYPVVDQITFHALCSR